MKTRAKPSLPPLGPGTVVRISISGEADGVALCTHSHREYGDLLRVFSRRLQGDEWDTVADVLQEPPAFSCFLLLKVGVRRGLQVVAHAEVPEHLRQFPVFRCTGLPDPVTRVESLWFWDGEREWRGEYDAYVRLMPTRAIWNVPYLVEAVRAGWTDALSGVRPEDASLH